MTENQFYLLKLIEECAEVAQRAAKQMQFGLYEIEPGQGETNRERLRNEINDLLYCIKVLEQVQEIPSLSKQELRVAMNKKCEKINQYLDYSRQLGFVK